MVTRLKGGQFALNVDLIERAETTPDTVIRMVDGSTFVVAETVGEIIAKVTEFKAAVLCAAASASGDHLSSGGEGAPHLRLVPDTVPPSNLEGAAAGPGPAGGEPPGPGGGRSGSTGESGDAGPGDEGDR